MNKKDIIQEDILRLFGGKGEIKLSVSQQKAEDGKEWVIITCEDNGAGWDWDQMPEDMWERYRYIKRATEQNNGIFEFKAVKGKGAVVTLKFPAWVNESKRIGLKPISGLSQGGGAMKKVLIVDDELEFTKDFAKALEMFGYEPYQAGDGESALNIIKDEKPEIVLCDYRLPDIDGDKILEKTKIAHPEVKFVMVTAYYDEVVEKRFRNLGADKVIFKPINLAEIEKMLEAL